MLKFDLMFHSKLKAREQFPIALKISISDKISVYSLSTDDIRNVSIFSKC